MKKKVIVISLGGSLIVPDKFNTRYLSKFKKTIRKYYKTHKFVLVCGGGSIARKYISALRSEKKSEKELSMAGIRATRMNAQFLMQIFGKEANGELPKDMKEIKNDLSKNNVVICGALRYTKKSTSDATASKIAHYLKGEFINMTNIKGLYTANPVVHKEAKFIPEISWKDFDKMANKTKYKPGQHFVLDQGAAKIIKEFKIPTYIIGDGLKNIEKILKKQKFIGTLVEG